MLPELREPVSDVETHDPMIVHVYAGRSATHAYCGHARQSHNHWQATPAGFVRCVVCVDLSGWEGR